MTVTGAAMVLSRLPGASDGRSLSFAFAERMKTKRAGEAFALVGPHLKASYSSRSVSSVTGLSIQALCVRGLRNSFSIHGFELAMACVSSISLVGSQSLWNLLAAVHSLLVADRPTLTAHLVGPNSPRGWNSKSGNLVCR